MAKDWLIEVRDAVKRYGGVTALKGVTLRVRPGTVHGLLGENGAGKSTLVRIIAGQTAATSGTILFEGEDVGAADVRLMEKRGVFLVTQEPMIADNMTVADNLLLGRWPARLGLVREREADRLARAFLAETGLDPTMLASELTAVEKRKLNILRALHSGGRLIVLDEPTTALTMDDKAHLFEFMRQLKARGVSFIFISHYNEEILEICDEVSILRDGEMVASGQSVAHVDSDSLSEMVIGRDVALFRRRPPPGPAAAGWSFRQIRARGLDVARLDIGRGEIVGFAGLPGSGARELGRALYGLLPGAAGHVQEGDRVLPLASDPTVALGSGIAFLSEDRLRDGIVAIQSVAENMALSSLDRLSRFGFVSATREQGLVARFAGLFAIKAQSAETPIGSLSGGNQQKVLLSRLVATQPRLVILNEPTRGIDVGVKEEVHRLIDSLTRDGVSVIVITSDLDEMLRVVDRVAMFVGGSIREIRSAAAMRKEDVFEAAFSAGGDRPRPAAMASGRTV